MVIQGTSQFSHHHKTFASSGEAKETKKWFPTQYLVCQPYLKKGRPSKPEEVQLCKISKPVPPSTLNKMRSHPGFENKGL